jgi:hypothetical protein
MTTFKCRNISRHELSCINNTVCCNLTVFCLVFKPNLEYINVSVINAIKTHDKVGKLSRQNKRNISKTYNKEN